MALITPDNLVGILTVVGSTIVGALGALTPVFLMLRKQNKINEINHAETLVAISENKPEVPPSP